MQAGAHTQAAERGLGRARLTQPRYRVVHNATAEALGERVARQVASKGTTAVVTDPFADGRQRGLGRAAFLRGVARESGRPAAVRFAVEAMPDRWCGREEQCKAVGVCVLDPASVGG